jgi:hypothetical protein
MRNMSRTMRLVTRVTRSIEFHNACVVVQPPSCLGCVALTVEKSSPIRHSTATPNSSSLDRGDERSWLHPSRNGTAL